MMLHPEYDPSPSPLTREDRPAVYIDGQRYLRVDITTLEDVAPEIEYPSPAPGWAVAHIHNVRYAAWFAGIR